MPRWCHVALVLASVLAAAPSSAQQLIWAKQIGGGTDDWTAGMALDAAGNIHLAGYFTGTVDFDPGPGTHVMTATSGGDLFVWKGDGDGNFAWVKRLHCLYSCDAGLVAVDPGGSVYTVGIFEGGFDADPSSPSGNLSSAGRRDVFIVKHDGAGQFAWAKRLGGTGDDGVGGLALDPSGNVLMVGSFTGTVDFDPGPGTHDLTSAGAFDAYVVKLDSGGNFVWAKRLGAAESDWAGGVAVDAAGNVHVVGAFQGVVDFDPGPGTIDLTSGGLRDAFVWKLDASGNLVWARHFGGASNDGASVLSLDATGSIHVAGSFHGVVDFNPGPAVYDLTGDSDVFVSKLSRDGDFVWARRLEGEGVADLAVDSNGNVYTVGWFLGTADFDPGPGRHDLVGDDYGGEVFVSRLDGFGEFVWATQLVGGGFNYASAVALDPRGNVYVAGSFYFATDFDPGPGIHTLTPSGFDAFLWKLSQACPDLQAANYGTLLFAQRCTRDASELPGGPGSPHVFDGASVPLHRGPSDRFYLSSRGTSFAGLVVDEAVRVGGQDSGLGPYAVRPGVPAFLIGSAIEWNLVPEPPHEVTHLIPAGSSTVSFEALDIGREIYGNTPVYLVRDCGIRLDGLAGGRVAIHFVSYDVDHLGMQSDLSVVTGILSELRSDRDFRRATCLGFFPDTTEVADTRPHPSAGEGVYYLVRGTCSDPTYGDSLGPSPDPRDALDAGDPCP